MNKYLLNEEESFAKEYLKNLEFEELKNNLKALIQFAKDNNAYYTDIGDVDSLTDMSDNFVIRIPVEDFIKKNSVTGLYLPKDFFKYVYISFDGRHFIISVADKEYDENTDIIEIRKIIYKKTKFKQTLTPEKLKYFENSYYPLIRNTNSLENFMYGDVHLYGVCSRSGVIEWGNKKRDPYVSFIQDNSSSDFTIKLKSCLYDLFYYEKKATVASLNRIIKNYLYNYYGLMYTEEAIINKITEKVIGLGNCTTPKKLLIDKDGKIIWDMV